ncbi:universal stress protein [uncultured Cellulomonas sp.]|uniref:universal stress protein n=1 Tax=uncultured Cellulomonas sp. TaxID=189682 RepID=UPI0026390F84|nr:universal stress protein [uncultured Cellulomonas sp.]
MASAPWPRTDGSGATACVTIELDGSVHDGTTLEWGLAEAALRGAPVLLARAVPDDPDPVQGEWYPSPHHPVHAEAAFALRELAEREGARRPGLRLSTRLVPEPQSRAVRDLSCRSQLLVVGPHVGGSVGGPAGPGAGHVVAHARCPVAVVTGRRGGRRGAPVVAGVDGSSRSAVSADLAAAEAALLGTGLVLVRASASAGPARPVTGVDEVVAALRARHPGLDVTVELVLGGPADVLVDRSRTAALLVLGPRGRGAVRGTLLGSVSAEVVRRGAGTILLAPSSRPPGRHRGPRSGPVTSARDA